MDLRVLVPGREVLRSSVVRVSGEGSHGSFTLLPDHVDLLTALVPGILGYQTSAADEEAYVAIDEGLLVKRGGAVVVTVRRAVPSPDLESLRQKLEEEFLRLDENERQSRRVLERLESSFLIGIIEIGGVAS